MMCNRNNSKPKAKWTVGKECPPDVALRIAATLWIFVFMSSNTNGNYLSSAAHFSPKTFLISRRPFRTSPSDKTFCRNQSPNYSYICNRLLCIRAGHSDVDEDEEFYSEDQEEEEDGEKVDQRKFEDDKGVETQDEEESADSTISVVHGIRNILSGSLSMLKSFTQHEKPNNQTLPLKFANILYCILNRAYSFFFPVDASVIEKHPLRKSEIKEAEELDLGLYLRKTYKVCSSASTLSTTNAASPLIRGGSLVEALTAARNEAKLLLIYIPAKKTNNDIDSACVAALTSPEVADVAENFKNGSYLIWAARADSTETNRAIKRLNIVTAAAKSYKGGRRPILLVSYPSLGVPKKSQQIVITPKTLAQHHCNPPPSALSMSQWLKALRKRHSKEIAKMKHSLNEQQLYKERQEGYKKSVNSDIQRDIEEKNKKAEDDAKKERELQCLEEKRQRREKLLESLPEEPAAGEEGAITIGLRFPDGKAAQRRFSSTNDQMQSIFHWLEGQFDVDMVNVKLTSMTGGKTFTYDSDGDAKVGDVISSSAKLVALRVIPTKDESGEKEKERSSKKATVS